MYLRWLLSARTQEAAQIHLSHGIIGSYIIANEQGATRTVDADHYLKMLHIYSI